MRRLFARNLLFIVGLNLLIKPVWVFVIDRTVQNRVGYADFGTYTALLNLAIIFQILIDFGLNSYNTRTISGEPERFATQFPLLLTARLFLMGLYAGVVMGAGVLWGYRGRELWLLGGVILLQSSAILLLFVRSNIAALQRYRLDGALSVLDRFLMIFICGALLLIPSFNFRIEYFVATQIVCYGVAIAAGILLLRRIAPIPQLFHFQILPVWKIIKEGAPYALLAFLMATYMRSDMLLVERLYSPDGKIEAGKYIAAYRLLDVASMVPIMIAGVLMPLFSRMLADKQDVGPIIRLCTNLTLPVSFIIATGCWLSGTDIMVLLYHHRNAYNGLLLALLMSSYPAYCIMYIYSTLLTAGGHIRLLNKLSLLGVVVNVGANIFLIPRYGAMGGAITTGVTQWMLAAFFIYFAIQRNKLPVSLRVAGTHLLFVILIAGAGFGIHSLALSWTAQGALLGIVGALLILIFRFISPKAVKNLLLKQ